MSSVGVAPAHYRLPSSAAVGRVTLQVGDLPRSVAYYRDVLGFAVIDETRSSGQARAELGPVGSSSSAHALVELREKRSVRPIPRRGLIGIYHFALLLPDRPALGRFLQHITHAGIHPGAADHLVSEALYLTDPDGIVVEIYRDRPRADWAVRHHELVMASDPLDAPSIIAEAGNVPWTGVPAGSRIGHMHFYVGDLAQAEAFYHVALGFDKTAWNFPGALFLSAGGYHHHVGTNVWAAGAPVATPDDAGLLWWELKLPDADAVAALQRSAVDAGYPVTRIEGGVSVTDPWGIVVQARA